ncbi:MAG: hypothetical protein ACI4RP_06270 [Acutalibacteraceae bacterium]
MKRVKASPSGEAVAVRRLMRGCSNLTVLDEFSRATTTSSGGRCRHLPLKGKA